ncbi:glycosyltransferase [Caenimonas terrae]|uniref:Glycosyltransferase n=1 Tax=Caenimonas terrae TaxID=696074 RepID=A0ABW0NJH9_9BURK
MKQRALRNAAWRSLVLPLLCYGAIAVPLFLWSRAQVHPLEHGTLLAIGVFGAWRYGWQWMHFVRAWLYARFHFPALRRQADAVAAAGRFPRRVFVVVASYLEEPWVSVESFQSLMANLAELPCEATVVVAVGSDADEAVINGVYLAHPGRLHVELVFQRQSQGKRIALGHALRAVARRYHDETDSVTVFMDGDSWLEPGALRRTLPFFTAFGDLGALTTNEVAWVHARSAWYKDWFALKFAERNVQFQSHSLSHKVMTLTGRFSMLRTAIVVTEEFIGSAIENDMIQHWMHGKFRFLMGDDKSSWFHVLRQGWKMLYIPDVTCCSLESRDIGFFKATFSLPYRWFGNTLRNNPRALALGPGCTGWFIWFCILDQRLSMWTSLVGISGALALAAVKTIFYLPMYIAWAVLVRLVQLVMITYHGHRVSMRSIPTMLYTQWVGAIIKIHASFHLNDQNWSKGKTRQDGGGRRNWLARLVPGSLMAASFAAFGFTVLVAHSALRMPDAGMFSKSSGPHVIDAGAYGVTPGDGQDDAAALQTIIDRAGGAPVVIRLPAGQLDFFKPVTIHEGGITLAGAGVDATRIVSHLTGRGSAVIGVEGKLGPELGVLAEAAGPETTALRLDRVVQLRPGELVLVKQPNDEAFFDAIGSQHWRRTYPFLRQALLKVQSADGNLLRVEQPAGLTWAAGLAKAYRVTAVADVHLTGFTIEQRAGDHAIAEVAHRYENLFPDVSVDGIALEWTQGVTIDKVAVLSAGRHPVSIENSYGFALRDCRLDGAWNKGDEGSGYLRIARSYRGLVSGCEVRNIRHIALQWSSAFNRLENIASGVDVNFHGGYSHHNVATAMKSEVPPQHKWGQVFRTPGNAGWAPPDGPGNEFTALGNTAPQAARASPQR